MLAWLSKLPGQVKKAWPSKRKGTGVVPNSDVLQTVTHLLEVLVQKKAEVEAIFSSASAPTPAQARFLHDVALACTMFGWLPPLRGKSVRTLCTNLHRGPCQDPDCDSAGCVGNRVGVCLGSSRLSLVLSHHKAEATWGTLEYRMPVDLSALLSLHTGRGWSLLRHHLGVDHPFMFMNADGQPFKDSSTFHYYWKALIASWGGPSLGPHLLRHVFVTQRMQSRGPSTPSQEDLGFACAMGHAHEQWDTSYNLVSLQQKVQQAVDSMPAWRASMLAGKHASVRLPHAPSADSEVQSADEGQANAEVVEIVDSEDGESLGSGVTVTSASSVSLGIDIDDD